MYRPGPSAVSSEIRSVRHSLPPPALLTMLHALVISKLDLTTATPCWPGHQKFYCAVSSRYWTPLPGWFSQQESLTHVFITPWTLAQSTGADQVPIMRVNIPLSLRWGTELPCWDHSPSFQLLYIYIYIYIYRVRLKNVPRQKLRFLKNRSVNLHVIFAHCKERICTYLDNMWSYLG